MDEIVGIPPPDNRHGYTDSLIKKILTKDEYKKFCGWMRGQTCAIDEKTKEIITYEYDLTRFVDMVRRNIPTIWD